MRYNIIKRIRKDTDCMKNIKNAKQIVNAYRIKRACIGVAYAAAISLFIYIGTSNALVGVIGVVALAATIRSAFQKLTEHDIEAVIYRDLNPKLFSEILELGVLARSPRHHILAAMTAGDHDEVRRLIEANKEKSKLNPIEKCNDLYRLGYICLEEEDLEALEAVVRDFKRLKAQNPKFAYAFSSFSVFEKFDAMLDDDHEYVVDACELDLSRLTSKEQNFRLTKINISYYRARSLYKLGRLDEAKQAFEEIIEYAPKMYKAQLSREYLKRIEENK